MAIYILIALLVFGLVFYLLLQRSIKRSVAKMQRPPEKLEEGTVQCFSCGMAVPKEKALEKKGRYFCGVKRNDRNGNPIVEEKEASAE